jgi:protein-disulfide isomerase
MFIRKFLMFLFLIFFSFSLVSVGFSEEGVVIDKEKKKQAERNIQRILPKFKVESMIKLPIDEIYAVVADDGAVIFYSPSGYLFFGDIINLKGESFLAKMYDGALKKILDTNDGRFFVKVSNGEYRVIAFLSLTNKNSKDVYKFLKEKKNLDFYVFPLVFSEDDVKLASYVYCAKDNRIALDEVFEEKIKVNDIKLDEACQKKTKKVLGINEKVAKANLVYSEATVLIGDKKIFGYQPFEIMKALYFLGWREGDGR